MLGWGADIYHSPHKDRQTRVCVCVCVCMRVYRGAPCGKRWRRFCSSDTSPSLRYVLRNKLVGWGNPRQGNARLIMRRCSPLAGINNLFCLFAFAALPRGARNSRTEAWKEGSGRRKGKKEKRDESAKDRWQRWWSLSTLTPTYPSCCILGVSAENSSNRPSRFFSPSPAFPSIPCSFPLHRAIALCLSVLLSSSLPPTPDLSSGRDGSHDTLWDDPPVTTTATAATITTATCHSSRPTNDSCLSPLTLSPLYSCCIAAEERVETSAATAARLFLKDHRNDSRWCLCTRRLHLICSTLAQFLSESLKWTLIWCQGNICVSAVRTGNRIPGNQVNIRDAKTLSQMVIA